MTPDGECHCLGTGHLTGNRGPGVAHAGHHHGVGHPLTVSTSAFAAQEPASISQLIQLFVTKSNI